MQPQLFAPPALSESRWLDYHMLAALLTDCPVICAVIELRLFRISRRFKRAAAAPCGRLLPVFRAVGTSFEVLMADVRDCPLRCPPPAAKRVVAPKSSTSARC